MSNYYCESSAVFKLTESTVEYAMKLYETMEEITGMGAEEKEGLQHLPDGLGRTLYMEAMGVFFEAGMDDEDQSTGFIAQAETLSGRPDHLWVYSEEDFDPNTACSFLRQVAWKCKVKKPFAMEFCYYCDKPHADAFGGGYFVANQHEERWGDTHRMAMKHVEELNKIYGDD